LEGTAWVSVDWLPIDLREDTEGSRGLTCLSCLLSLLPPFPLAATLTSPLGHARPRRVTGQAERKREKENGRERKRGRT
jgi:hypothetical protein